MRTLNCDQNPAGQAPPAASARKWSLGVCLLTALGIAIALANIPRTVITPEIDPSFGAVLTYAHQHGLQFGKDIVFTYGPLGYLFIQEYSGYGTGLRLVADLLLVYLVSAGACLWGWKMAPGWRLLFLGFLVFSPANTVRAADLLFPIGLLCWGLLCLSESDRTRALIYDLMLALLVGVLSLVKFTFVIEGGLTLLAVAADRILRGQGRRVPWLIGACAVVFLAGWLALGQQVAGLWKYAVNSWAVARGYDLAMAGGAEREVRVGGVAVVVLTVLALAVRSANASDNCGLLPLRRRLVLGLWLFLVAAVSWKHGYVRGDHVAIFLGFAAVLALALEAVDSGALVARQIVHGSAITATILTCTTLDWSTPGVLDHRLDRVFTRFSANLRTLVRPSVYKKEMAEKLAQECARNQLPKIRAAVGNATLDIFGHSQAYAVFNQFSYRPRPVFQSYCAYSPALARLNQDFYRCDSAPEYVLFNLSPIDGRLPAIEDSRALATILARYRPVNAEGMFILLQRTNAPDPALSLARAGTAAPGEPISLSEYGTNDLWMEITLKSSWLGRLQEFFYAPPQVKLGLHLQPGSAADEEFRAPAPMLAAGFIISPLLRTNSDVLGLYAGTTNTRPASVSVELRSQGKMFRRTFQYRIYKFQTP